MAARIAPAVAPFSHDVQTRLERLTPPGMEPIALFTTLARDERLFAKLFAGALLDRGHLTLRQREIVIDRTTARCRSEYEWGIHVALFGPRAHLTEEQIYSSVHGDADDPCWSADEKALLRMCDELHQNCSLSDAAWAALRRHFSEEAVLELLMLAGYYRTVSYLTNALRLPIESAARRFPSE